VKFSWTVSRHSDNPSTVGVVSETQTNFLQATLPDGKKNPERVTLAHMLNDTYDGPPLNPLKLEKLFPKFVKVSNRGKAAAVTQLTKQKGILSHKQLIGLSLKIYYFAILAKADRGFRDLYLTLDRDNDSREHWWEVGESCTDDEYRDLLSHLPLNDRCRTLQMYTFNDKAFPAGLSFFSGGG